jgi:hypothetical protein
MERSGTEAAYVGLTMSTDKKGTKILARTFFTQLRAGGYTPNQILDISSELIELVTSEMKEISKLEGAKDTEVRPNA